MNEAQLKAIREISETMKPKMVMDTLEVERTVVAIKDMILNDGMKANEIICILEVTYALTNEAKKLVQSIARMTIIEEAKRMRENPNSFISISERYMKSR